MQGGFGKRLGLLQTPWLSASAHGFTMFHLGSKALRAQPITRLLLTGSCLHHSWVCSSNSCVQHEANRSKPISTYVNLMSLALLEFRGGIGPLASRSLRPWNSRGIASPWVSFVSTRRRSRYLQSESWPRCVPWKLSWTHTHTHTEYIYMYIYILYLRKSGNMSDVFHDFEVIGDTMRCSVFKQCPLAGDWPGSVRQRSTRKHFGEMQPFLVTILMISFASRTRSFCF